jgi:hypothetical protein
MKRGICAILILGALAAFPAAAQAVSAPVLTSVTQTSSRHIKVAWSGQFMSPVVEIAASTGVDSTGYFTDPNAIYQPLDDFETSFESDALAAGTYYVHVGGIDPTCLPCSFQFSSVRSIKVGSGGAGKPKKEKKPSLFSVLSVPHTQRIGSLYVRAGLVLPGTIRAGGTVSVAGKAAVFRLKSVSAPTPSKLGTSVKLRLKLPAKARSAVKRALGRGKKVRAKIKITGRPVTGSAQSTVRTVKLKP